MLVVTMVLSVLLEHVMNDVVNLYINKQTEDHATCQIDTKVSQVNLINL